MTSYGNPAIGVREDLALIEHEGRSPGAVQQDVEAAKAQMGMLQADEQKHQPLAQVGLHVVHGRPCLNQNRRKRDLRASGR